jgi:copper chaperone CopZ
MVDAMNQTLSIAGMTCENCRRHVTEALAALPGVRSVRVDLASGTASLETDRAVGLPEAAKALEEAGYSLGS